MVELFRTFSILSLVLLMNCFSRNQAHSIHHLRSHFSRGHTDPETGSITNRPSHEEGMRRNTFRELMDMMHSVNHYLRRINSRHSRRLRNLKHTSLKSVLATSLNPTTSSLKSATSYLKSATLSLNPAHELLSEVYSPAGVTSKNPADSLKIASALHNPIVSSRKPTGFSQNPALSSQNRALTSKKPTLVSQNPTVSPHRLAKEHSTLVPKRNFTKVFKSMSKPFRAKRFRIRHFKMQYGNNRPFDSLANGLIG